MFEPVAGCSTDVGQVDGNYYENVSKKRRIFKEPEKDSDIDVVSNKVFAKESQRKIKWAVNLYSQWRLNRIGRAFCPNQIINANLDNLNSFSQVDLAFSLSHFIREIKKLDGNEYPPNTLREMIITIQMFLHSNSINWKLLDGGAFVAVRDRHRSRTPLSKPNT